MFWRHEPSLYPIRKDVTAPESGHIFIQPLDVRHPAPENNYIRIKDIDDMG